MSCFITHYASPLGRLLLAADEEGLTGLWLEGQKYFAAGLPQQREEQRTPALEEACRWLDTYFTGREPDFTPPLHPVGSDFQRAVWPAGAFTATSMRPVMWSPVSLSIIPAPISGKRAFWSACSSRYSWNTARASPSMATTCGPAPCWKIPISCRRW